jgi:hypothetical protein
MNRPGRHPAGPNKRALIAKHLELASQNYNDLIEGSRVRIFQPNALTDQEILQTRLASARPPVLAALDQPWDLQQGSLHYHLTAGPFVYRDGEAYVDFANKKIGGGVLGGGFVQEEIMLLETNFLPWVAAVRGSRHSGTTFARDISLKQLDRVPVVIGVRRFLEVANQSEIYGPRLEQRIPFQADQYLRLLPRPQDIYLTALVAKDYGHARGGPRYTRDDIEAMTVTAARGFYDTLMAQHGDGKPLVIHTGNWGAGAFGNSKRTIWAMQRAAMEAAYVLFSQTTGQTPQLDFYYDAFDAAGVRAANEAFNVFVTTFPDRLTLGEYVQQIFQRTLVDAAWQTAGARRGGPR